MIEILLNSTKKKLIHLNLQITFTKFYNLFCEVSLPCPALPSSSSIMLRHKLLYINGQHLLHPRQAPTVQKVRIV